MADFKGLIRADQEGNIYLICKYRVKVKVNGVIIIYVSKGVKSVSVRWAMDGG